MSRVRSVTNTNCSSVSAPNFAKLSVTMTAGSPEVVLIELQLYVSKSCDRVN